MNIARRLAYPVVALALVACSKSESPPPPAALPVAPATSAPVVEAATTPPASPASSKADERVTIKQLTLARQLGEDNLPAAAASDFAPGDTVYAVVETTGAGRVKIKANWTYRQDAKLVQFHETEKELNLSGPTATEFHISKPHGWAAGEYQVEVTVNGGDSRAQKFTIK